MPLSDYAIVVGISSYPTLGPGDTALTLDGAAGGAKAVADWLQRDGGVPKANIELIQGMEPQAGPTPEPTPLRIEAAMANLDRIARDQIRAGAGELIGRRLYIYMSGHGFSPGGQQSCLFTANAQERLTYNVHATAWLKWFQDAGYFREFVLWMDCCMDRLSFLNPGDPPIRPTFSDRVPGPTFAAFAAQRPLKAAEVLNPATDRMEGAFTWALLDGLKGAAVDPNGRVTGRSLADWLRQSVRARLPDAAAQDFDIAKEPEIVSETGELIFARALAPKTFAVSLQGGGLAPSAEVVLWTGSPLREEMRVAHPSLVELSLPAGLYHAEVTGTDWGASFEVVCNRVVYLTQGHQGVQPPPRNMLFLLDYNPPDPAVEITIVDHAFAAVERDVGRIQTRLPGGLYKLRARSGRAIDDTVLLLDRDMGALGGTIAAPTRATVAPIMGTLASHEYQASAAIGLVRRGEAERNAKRRPAITLMARAFSEPGKGVERVEPWSGLSIVDQMGNSILESGEGELHRVPGQDPFSLAATAVRPGTYFLRHRLVQPSSGEISTVEQSLIVPRGWNLEVHVLRRVIGDVFDSRPRISVHMAHAGLQTSEREREMIEAARTALADERPVMGDEMKDLLVRKFDNPIAGILGAHLMILGEDMGQNSDPTLFNTVIQNLRRLVGSDHTDVVALSLRCRQPELRTRKTRLSNPPMFERSWRLLVAATRDNPRLISAKLIDRLLVPSAFPPFLVWPEDDPTRSRAIKELRIAVLAPPAMAEFAPTAPRASPTKLASFAIKGFAKAAKPSATKSRTGQGPKEYTRKEWRLARERAHDFNLPQEAVARLIKQTDEVS